MIETRAIADLFVSAKTATVNIKPNALRLRKDNQVYVAESLEKLQDAIASLGKAGTAMLALITQTMYPAAYVSRGDPALPDYDTGTLTMDGAWHKLDLSAIVPAGATAVLLRVFLKTTVAGKFLTFRRNGNTNYESVSTISTQVANQNTGLPIPVEVDANRICEYVGTSGVTWTICIVTVIGWWT